MVTTKKDSIEFNKYLEELKNNPGKKGPNDLEQKIENLTKELVVEKQLTNILKNKVTIDMSVSEYDTLFKYIGKLDSMLNTLHETNDLWLSDVHNLSSLKWELTQLLDAEWNPDTYRYVKRGSK